jgi:small subunit ribosomal protein S20
MPIHRSAVKKIRQDRKRTERNLLIKRRIKSLTLEYKKSPSLSGLQKIQSVLFRAAKTNIVHKNKAGRILSRLAKQTPKKVQVKPSSKSRMKTT